MKSGLLVLVLACVRVFAIDFVPNVGQLSAPNEYSARSRNMELLADRDGTFTVRSRSTPHHSEVRFVWLGGNAGSWTPDALSGRQVRFCSNDHSQKSCQEDTPTYTSVRRSGLYAGIDLVLHGAKGTIEYDLVLQPGARVEDIQFQLQSSSQPVLDNVGRIVSDGIVQWMPVAYQLNGVERLPVTCAVRQISERVFGFTVTGNLRTDLPLIIDPVMEAAQLVAGVESAEDRVFGRGAGHIFGVSKRAGSTNWDVFVSYGSRTTYWGGDGDDQIRGFEAARSDSALALVGRTTSTNAFTTGSRGGATSFNGGESDGFFLEFYNGNLIEAALIGGPGADSLNDVRMATSRSGSGYLVVGETENPAWPRFQMQGQPAGGKDAVVGWFGTFYDTLLVMGGPAADSATLIRAIPGKPEEWIVAGETESEGFGGKTAPGVDLWLGHVTSVPLCMDNVRSWGGTGEYRLAGLGFIAGHGAILAGTTRSSDLPGAAKTDSRFNGGDSDGFVAWFDPVDFSPLQVRYLGGPGADEILSMQVWSNDLFLTGLTDSLTLSLDGLLPGSDPAGLQDGLFIHADAFLRPMTVYRAGGAGNDRFSGVEPKEWGRVNLSGWSESSPWLATMDPAAATIDRTAGFTMTLRYPVVALPVDTFPDLKTTPVVLTLGRDTQMHVSVLARNEPASDGVLIARSADPAKLRIAGEEAVLFNRVGQPNVPPMSLSLEALADEGEVEILIAGRTPAASPVRYPERRVQVHLTPSRFFLQSIAGGILYAPRGFNFQVNAILADLLPNGAPGTMRNPRSGVEVSPSLTFADPEAFLRDNDSVFVQGDGTYRMQLRPMKVGDHVLTLQSTGIPAAPEQRITVRVFDGSSPPTPSWPLRTVVLVDHTLPVNFELAAGDRLTFTVENSQRIGVGSARSDSAPSVVFDQVGLRTLWVSALQAGEPVGIRVEGRQQGRLLNERIEVLPWPGAVTVGTFYAPILPVGTSGLLTLQTKAAGTPPTGFPFEIWNQYIRAGSPLEQAVARFSNPAVATLISQSVNDREISIRFATKQAGQTKMELAGDRNSPPVNLEVVALRLHFGTEIVVPGFSKVDLTPAEKYLDDQSYKGVRLRVSDPQLFSLQWFDRTGPDITVDYSYPYYVLLEAKGPPGSTGMLTVSAPGIAEFQVPIRVVEKVLVPHMAEIPLVLSPNEPEVGGQLHYNMAAYDSSGSASGAPRVLPVGFGVSNGLQLRVAAEPAGICDLPAEVNTAQLGFSIPFRCRQVGRVRISIESPGLAKGQDRIPVWLTVTRAPQPLAFEGVILSLANGTQGQFRVPYNDRQVTWTLVSRDPARVKLSTAATRPGGERVTLPSTGGSVVAQAFAGEGLVWIDAEADNGLRETFPVFLYPATMAVRTRESLLSQVRIPADQATLLASAGPFAVDPGSGLVLSSGEPLALRAGLDPFFLKLASSAAEVATPDPPNPLFSEGDVKREVAFKINGRGSAILTVEQPPGFTVAPSAGLRVSVVERELRLAVAAVAPGLQSNASISYSGPAFGRSCCSLGIAPITLTSLNPEKLLLSANRTSLGTASLQVTGDAPFVVQVLNTAQPGDHLQVRVSARGFADSITEIPVSAAELQREGSSSPVQSISPGTNSSILIRYGPVDPLNEGKISQYWSGGLLPGTVLPLNLRVSDPATLALPRREVELNADSYVTILMQGLRPGETELTVSAPEGVVNRAERIGIRVELWRFPGASIALSGARGLWAPITLHNPRPEPTTIGVRSAGSVPILFGPNVAAEPANSLNVTVPANGQTTIYWTSVDARSGGLRMELTAPDFAADTWYMSIDDPRLAFEAVGSLQLLATNRTAALPIRLLGYGGAEGPAAVPIRLDVRSSDPTVLRVPAGPVDIRRGQSRAVINADILKPGTVSLTATTPDPGGTSGMTGTLTVIVK